MYIKKEVNMYIIKLSTRNGGEYLSKRQGVEKFTKDLNDALHVDSWARAADMANEINEQLEADGEPVKPADKTRYAYVVKSCIEEYIDSNKGRG